MGQDPLAPTPKPRLGRLGQLFSDSAAASLRVHRQVDLFTHAIGGLSLPDFVPGATGSTGSLEGPQ